MKKIIIVLFIVYSISFNVISENILSLGDNVNDFYLLHETEFKKTEVLQLVNGWPDIIIFLTYSNNEKSSFPPLIGAQALGLSGIPFGTKIKNDDEEYYLISMNNNYILNLKADDIIIPYWILFPTEAKRDNNPAFIKMMNFYYETYNSNQGPIGYNITLKKGVEILNKAASTTTMSNRDLFLAFNFYIYCNQEYKESSLECIKKIDNEVIKRFKKRHLLPILYTLESLINLGDFEEAKLYLNLLLTLDPNYIPALVYDYNLEDDKEIAKLKLEKLKKKYPNHWIVKQLE